MLGLGGGLGASPSSSAPAGAYVAPRQTWLSADKGKGLELSGTFVRAAGGQIRMDMTFSNKSMGPLSGFGIQFNKNRDGGKRKERAVALKLSSFSSKCTLSEAIATSSFYYPVACKSYAIEIMSNPLFYLYDLPNIISLERNLQPL